MSPELPNFSRGNNSGGRRNSDSEQQNQIVWVDSEDVYKPIPKKVSDFTAERGIDAKVTSVYVKADALNSLKAHLASNLRVEQGGILFGNAYEDEFLGIYVEIVAAVAAPATIGTGAHLEFTPDSWLGIMNYARSEHPDENIVGWYHSHPNMAVFMSGTDMRTQQSFFYHPWCLSIVHDPVSEAIGYFLGESAVPVKPVIFGRIKSVNEPPEDRKEIIPAIEDINTQIGGSLVGIDKQPEISPRKQNKFLSLPLWVWLMLLVALVIILFGQYLHNTISKSTTDLPNSTASKLDVPFKASLKNIPATVLRYLENEKNLLRYPVVKAGEKLGTGEEVTLLVISKQGTDVTENIQLEVKQLTPNKDVEIVKVIDSLKTQTTSLVNYDSVVQSKPLPLKFLSPEAGVMIPLFSSTKVSSSATSVNSDNITKSNKIREGEIIYVPIKLMYKDSNENQKEVELKEILTNGSESE
jgi:proteasome lid subunit RPN8/RPN11